MPENADYNPQEVVDRMQALLGDSELLLDCQKRVAQVVDYCVSNVLNAGEKTNHVAKYAQEVGKGLETIWLQLCKKSPVLKYLKPRIPYGVLYINSLGIKWRLFRSGHPYDYRVAVYIGPYFEINPDAKEDENKYNEGIFSEKSRHLLYLTCTSNKPQPIVLRNRDIDNYVPHKRSVIRIEVPQWGGSASNLNIVKTTAELGLDENKDTLDGCFDWLNGKDENQLRHLFHQAGLTIGKGRIDILRSIFNLYRGWARVGKDAQYPVTHYVYLPDLILPGFAPAGFAGPLCLDCFKNAPSEYDFFLRQLQTFFSRYFGHVLQASESEIIHVSMEEELKGKETWQKKYISEKVSVVGQDIPLISNLSTLGDLDAPLESSDFDIDVAVISNIISDQFSSRACPETPSVKSPEEAASSNPPESGFPDEVLRSPVFGYQALSRRALHTIKSIWEHLSIIPPGREEESYPECLLYKLVERLLGFEPTLHYFPGYRDHFVHSFNSYLLGLWLLWCKDSDGDFIILPNVKPRDPDKEDEEEEEESLTRERLLRLWTIAAPLHDIAYPVQELTAGINELFRQYTTGGCQTIKDFDLSPMWSTGMTKRHYYAFFHESLRDVTSGDLTHENGNATERPPLMLEQASREHVSATIVSAELARRLLEDGDHGIWGALFVRNYLYSESDDECKSPPRRKTYCLDQNDEQDICFALACHHIWERWKTEGAVKWQLSSKHALTYLLTLVDALSQWGRTREVRIGEEGKDEETKGTRLVAIRLYGKGKTSRIQIFQHYPKANEDLVKKLVGKHTKVPLRYLSIPHAEIRLEVLFFDDGWDGNLDTSPSDHAELRIERTAPDNEVEIKKSKPKVAKSAKSKPKVAKSAKSKPKASGE